MKYTVLVDGRREPNHKLGSMLLCSLDTIAWMEILTEMGFKHLEGTAWVHIKDPNLILHLKFEDSLTAIKVIHGLKCNDLDLHSLVFAKKSIELLLTEIRNIYRS